MAATKNPPTGKPKKHKRVTKFPKKLPKKIDPDAREAFLILNDWAQELQRWAKKVSNAVGHDGDGDHRASSSKGARTVPPSHIVGDPPHPPFVE